MKKVQTSREKLEAKVEARQRFLEQVIHFVSSVVSQRGKRLMYDQSSCHTYSVRELQNFFGFTFTTEGRYTMFGGQNIVVQYRSGATRESKRVLEVEWWDPKELRVHVFDSGMRWQHALLRLIGNPEQSLERYDKALQREAKRAARTPIGPREPDERLQATAKRLGL